MDTTSDLMPNLVGPSDDGYDEARVAWNLAADLRPAAVATATSAEQVAAVVRHATDQGLRVVPQGTGHLASGLGDISDAILLKTALGSEIVVDAAAGSVRVGAGAVWQEVLDALAPHGLAALSGSSHDVGVIGYTVGGGLSWFARSKGLAADHVTAVEVVTAAGELVRATADNEPDLFWALRGGGGNFGVVTAIEFDVFPVPGLAGGIAIWDGEHAPAILKAWLAFTRDAPATVTTAARILQLPPLPDIPEPLRARPLVAIDGAALGGLAEAEALLAPLRAIAAPILDTWGAIPPEALTTIHMDPPGPVPGLGHHALLGPLPDEALDAFLSAIGPGSGSPLLSAELRHVSGCDAHGGAAAGAGRVDADYTLYGVGALMDPALAPAITERLELMVGALSPWSTGRQFINFAERGGSAEPAFDAETYARLQAVRATYDPDERFVASVRIEPATR